MYRTVRADEVRVGDTIVVPLPDPREPDERIPTEVLVDTIEHAHTAQGRRIRLWHGIGAGRDHVDVAPAAFVHTLDRAPRSNHQASPAIDLTLVALVADLDTWWDRLPQAHREAAFRAVAGEVPTLVLSLDDLGPWWRALRPAQRLRVYRAARPAPAPVAERLAAEAAGWSRLIDALDLVTRPNTPETTP